MDRSQTNRIVIAAFFLILAYISFEILKGFFIAIFLGAVIAYTLFPLHRKLERHTGSARVSSVVLSIIAITVLLGLSSVLLPEVQTETQKLYEMYATTIKPTLQKLQNCGQNSTELDCQAFSYFSKTIVTKDNVEKIAATIIPQLPSILLQLTIVLFSTSYFLRNGEEIVASTLKAVPIKDAHKNRIEKRMEEVLNAVIYGNMLTAFLEGIALTVLFLILDINMAFIAGMLVMFFALIPPMGAMIIWGPAVLILAALGDYTRATLLLIFCVVVMGFIDNIGRPMIIGSRVKLSSFWVLLGVLGGLAAFGIAGIILGPLILSLFVTSVKILGEELTAEEEYLE